MVKGRFSSRSHPLPLLGLLFLQGRGEGRVGSDVGRALPCSHLPSMENTSEERNEGVQGPDLLVSGLLLFFRHVTQHVGS